MKAHIVENGVVVNTIEVDSLDVIENLIPGDAGGIGWLFDGQALMPPPEPPPIVPQVVSMRQARLALLGAGMLDTVNVAIAQAGGAAQIEWEYASEVRRDSPLVAGMAAALGLDAAALDALFIQAATL